MSPAIKVLKKWDGFIGWVKKERALKTYRVAVGTEGSGGGGEGEVD